LDVELGNWDGALRQLKKFRTLVSPEAPVYQAELGEILRARVHIYRGEPKAAVNILESINDSLVQKDWPFHLCIARLWLAAALLLVGEKESARKSARDALRLARAMPAIHLLGHAHLLLARAVSSSPGGRPLLASQHSSSNPV